MHDNGHLAERDKHNHVRAENRRRTPTELRHDLARYRGAAHPLCFTDEVMGHDFPEGFKPVNIKSYNTQQTSQCGLRIFFSTFIWPATMIFTPSNTSRSNSRDQLDTGKTVCPKTPLAAGRNWRAPSSTTSKAHMSDLRMPMT